MHDVRVSHWVDEFIIYLYKEEITRAILTFFSIFFFFIGSYPRFGSFQFQNPKLVASLDFGLSILKPKDQNLQIHYILLLTLISLLFGKGLGILNWGGQE